MKVEIETPEDYLGNVMCDVSRRGGILQGQDDSPSGKIINAQLPLGEMFGYATSLRSMSQGRATFTMEFDHYAEAPANIAETVTKKGRFVIRDSWFERTRIPLYAKHQPPITNQELRSQGNGQG